MNIYVKFCGGCNPRYDRMNTVREIGRRLPAEIQFGDPDKADIHLLVAGCERSCPKGLGRKYEIVIDHLADIDEVVRQILKMEWKNGEL